jgi:hypothetical protein
VITSDPKGLSDELLDAVPDALSVAIYDPEGVRTGIDAIALYGPSENELVRDAFRVAVVTAVVDGISEPRFDHSEPINVYSFPVRQGGVVSIAIDEKSSSSYQLSAQAVKRILSYRGMLTSERVPEPA